MQTTKLFITLSIAASLALSGCANTGGAPITGSYAGDYGTMGAVGGGLLAARIGGVDDAHLVAGAQRLDRRTGADDAGADDRNLSCHEALVLPMAAEAPDWTALPAR